MWSSRVVVACSLVMSAVVGAQGPPPPPPLPVPSAPGARAEWLAPAHAVAVSGVVVDAATGAPIADAVVEVSVGGRLIRTDAGRPRTSDARGRFVFEGLPPGDLAVHASATGFLSSGFSPESRASVDRFPARAGEWVSDLRIALVRPAVLAGRVIDERGDPVVGVNVGVLERVRVAGADHYMSGRAAVTDDRGAFRIIDLTPGTYLVLVPGAEAAVPVTPARLPFPGQPPTPPPDMDGLRRTYAPTFHPAARDVPAAQTVTLHAGETREGIDVHLDPVRATRLSGAIEGPTDWIANIAVRLIPTGGTGTSTDVIETRTDGQGRFTFDRIAEGAYTLVATRRWSELTRGARLGEPALRPLVSPGVGNATTDLESGPPGVRLSTSTMAGSHALVATQPLVVSGDAMSGVVVTARPLAALRGHLTREIDARHPTPTLQPAGGLLVDPADGSVQAGMPRSDVKPDDPATTFTIAGISPGPFHLRSSFGWLIKSVTWNGRDYTYRPFDPEGDGDVDDVQVVVTNAVATISGTVRGLDDVAAGATVVLFPTDPARWTHHGLMPVAIRRAQTAAEGRYTFTGLPAGSYALAAVPASSPIELHEDTFRRLQPQAATITIDWGESRPLDLRAIGGQP